ncbi:unnamed protein product [Pipistrellus nathusii]|uniref:Uncharacterized protein n=1 Tax=Pipistrellus nathusii TaxID=59473 RepID=A0ABN9Z2Z6_PIPNA
MGSPCCPLPQCICQPFPYLTALSSQALAWPKPPLVSGPRHFSLHQVHTALKEHCAFTTLLCSRCEVPCASYLGHPNGRAEESSSVSNTEATTWLGIQDCLGKYTVSEPHLLPWAGASLGRGTPSIRLS